MERRHCVRKREKVIIVGGGVAGLTAAHELIERDFDVVVYERKYAFGGKAASVRVSMPLPAGAGDCPGEHGFRFFPGWYRHLPDSMKRIPFRDPREWTSGRNVFDNLVPTERNLLVQYDREPLPVALRAPTSPEHARASVEFLAQLQRFGLSASDALFLLRRLSQFIAASDDVRKSRYDDMSWREFIEADERSPSFRAIAVAITRTLVAAKAEEASAYTIATMAIRTLFDSFMTPDRVLNGPTNEAWIDAWVSFLEARGVVFHSGHELLAISCEGSMPRIRHLEFQHSSTLLEAPLRRAAERADGVEALRAVATELDEVLRQSGQAPRRWPSGESGADALRAAILAALTPEDPPGLIDDADHYVFALPVEQMAYYIDRSTMLRWHAPQLEDIIELSTSVDWMVGIQFFLRRPLELPRGHIVCADSEWALTALEQTQFWSRVPLPPDVRSILSVDISAWDRRGRFTQKEAYRCTRDEVAREVWAQLKGALNTRGQQEILRDEMLVNDTIDASYYLDDNLIERHDRKKQAAYLRDLDRNADRASERASARAGHRTNDRGVDALRDLVGHEQRTGQPPHAPARQLPFVAGERLQINTEPLLINRPGTWRLRPETRTQISNMFLAADYVKTEANLACMEGANEAARHAVNAILEVSGSKHARCRTWRFSTMQGLLPITNLLGMFERASLARASRGTAAGVAQVLGSIAARATKSMNNFGSER
jgi:uncharacterized protein with NAD-binding domain and iron-sulfur cluster